MYGVIKISEPISESILLVYSDLPSAISYFFELNDQKDISIEPNINHSSILLSTQNFLYKINNFEKYDLPEDAILNIGIIRDKNNECRLHSVLLVLSKELIEKLSNYYTIEEIFLREEKCNLCKSIFKVWDQEKNCGYQGCKYNPIYYAIITIENLGSYHLFGSDIQPYLDDLNFDKSKIFFMNMEGGLNGLLLSKFPLPENWYHGMIFCWNCMDNMRDKFESIWSH